MSRTRARLRPQSWIGGEDAVEDDLVDRDAGEGLAQLVVDLRVVALHEADVGRAGADVDVEGIRDRVLVLRLIEPALVAVTEGGEEGLRHEDDLVEDTLDSRARVLAGGHVGARGHTDDGAHLGVAGIEAVAQVLREVLGRRLVLDHAALEGAHEGEIELMLQGILTEEHLRIAREDALEDVFGGVSDHGRNLLLEGDLGFVAAPGSGHETGRVRTPIEADEQRLGFGGPALARGGGGRLAGGFVDNGGFHFLIMAGCCFSETGGYALRATWAADSPAKRCWGGSHCAAHGQHGLAHRLEFGLGQGIEHVRDVAERHPAAEADGAGRPRQARGRRLARHPGDDFIDDHAPLHEAQFDALLDPAEQAAQAHPVGIGRKAGAFRPGADEGRQAFLQQFLHPALLPFPAQDARLVRPAHDLVPEETRAGRGEKGGGLRVGVDMDALRKSTAHAI